MERKQRRKRGEGMRRGNKRRRGKGVEEEKRRGVETRGDEARGEGRKQEEEKGVVRRGESMRQEDRKGGDERVHLYTGSFPNLQTPEESGKPGLSNMTSHTHSHTLKSNLSHNYTTASPCLSFLSSSLSSCVFGSFFSSAHDALWHNETVKRSPVEAGAKTRRGWGV